MKGRPRRGP
ncbi:unnamed protein product, partial [Didymodactylos carnosus]